MKKKIVAALLAVILVLTLAGLFAYDYLVETGPTAVAVTYYRVDYFGNTGASQQQLPDTVVQFAATIEVNSGFFHLVQREGELNFDDFYLTSGNRTLAPLQGYSEMMSHGDFTVKSGPTYAWDALFVVEKGIATVELHYNGTANVNIVHLEGERPNQNYPVVGQK